MNLLLKKLSQYLVFCILVCSAKKVFDFDPRARHTLWNLILNNLTVSISAYGLSQASVQRALSLKKKRDIIKYVYQYCMLKSIQQFNVLEFQRTLSQ